MQPNPTLAIVGSGPAGCYLAQTLRRSLPDAEITIFERLASPFGLVRYGVAPDHQGTKSIQAQFARLFERDNVRFAGNIDVGSVVTLDDLRATHHVVVLATGLARDRRVGVPGENLLGVFGAGQLTRTANSHPLEKPTLPPLGRTVAIIGGGNVSLDVVRFLIKTPGEFAGSDVNDVALEEYAAAPVTHIDLICRSSPEAAPFDPAMVAELGKTPGVQFTSLDHSTADGTTSVEAHPAALAALLPSTPGGTPRVRVRLHFNATTTRIIGMDHAVGVEVRRPDGQLQTIPAQSVITAVGFDCDPSDPLIGDRGASQETGYLAEGLYRTGWAKRGARGTIPENRHCAKAVAAEILEYLAAAALPAKPGYAGLPDAVHDRATDYAGWLRVDAAERAAAPGNRSRKKLPDHAWMVATARETVQK
ncbi:putative ferredoxin--NADP(+) reductase [Arthrobacter globiformis NBRC 12137]|uniref:ferredoxin--NADP(+) reductase n=1 Tax=Arthrobacter globiformis (strain ATCC 8010 / DSM 20124 / JCM 1332 / NBRC 12137 / NCIMB 8907 / NRRL B-2979 / 168) TaxID=1077972 RepID=H0QK39_ARTG1|nr:FAD-dependent oxidoreductase [Arthrobacter globiformis]GAB13279.1 putative ferredoxin--NADP(+) reductase [Arthrobacter globiformis NBRC 12137]